MFNEGGRGQLTSRRRLYRRPGSVSRPSARSARLSKDLTRTDHYDCLLLARVLSQHGRPPPTPLARHSLLGDVSASLAGVPGLRRAAKLCCSDNVCSTSD